MRVLVTGACGWTASSILGALREANHEVAGLDLPGVEPRHEVRGELHRADVADLDALLPLLESSDVVVHLAVDVGARDRGWPDRAFRTNVQGTYAVFEAARRCSVRKVVLIGSAPVHLPLQGRRVDARSDRPSHSGDDFLYDLTKYLQEDIARQFCETHSMTAVTLRAGHIVDGRAGRDAGGRPLSELQYCRGGWVCRYDLAQAVVAAVDWPGHGYEAFHIIGALPAREVFDVERAETGLGLRFRCDFSEY